MISKALLSSIQNEAILKNGDTIFKVHFKFYFTHLAINSKSILYIYLII